MTNLTKNLNPFYLLGFLLYHLSRKANQNKLEKLAIIHKFERDFYNAPESVEYRKILQENKILREKIANHPANSTSTND